MAEFSAPFRRALRSGVEGLAAVLFPSLCLVCREALFSPLEGPLCPRCLEAIPRIQEPFCPRCGLPYAAEVAPGWCGPCRRGPRYYRIARALCPYVEEVRLCLHALKYGGRRRIATVLGAMAARSFLENGGVRDLAAVVPLPLSRKRRRERGFNQASILARSIARESRLPLARRLLRKTVERPPQAGLSAAARRKNAAAAYRARLPARLRGASLLLFDDVLTTGATAESAARALLLAGAGAVDVLTVARVR